MGPQVLSFVERFIILLCPCLGEAIIGGPMILASPSLSRMCCAVLGCVVLF